jgi:predicted secreted protein with PEFG-CTERM motif
MKLSTLSSLFVLMSVVSMIAIAPSAFADVTVTNAAGSSTPGCEDTADGCFIPSPVTIPMGGTVTWENNDTAAHTATGGSATEGPSGVFDSSLIMAGSSFSHTFDAAGTFDYFCMVHPWMAGTVIVEDAAAAAADAAAAEAAAAEAAAAEAAAAEAAAEEAAAAEAADVELMVVISDSAVMGGTQVELEFSELHVNYDIIATQNGEVVFEETGLHSMENFATHQIDAVGSDENPIDVEVVSLGIGAPGNEDDWTGPVGQVATAKVVPEFGTIAMMVLVVAIISIVAVTAKSRIVPRF